VLRLMPPSASSRQFVLERRLRLSASLAALDYAIPEAAAAGASS
jgi:hypothetical protein